MFAAVDIKRDIDLFGLPKSRRSGVGMQIEHPVNNNNTTSANNNRVASAADVKTERLSPVVAAGGDSASSRSGTPSSSCYPGTPPGVSAAADRVSSPAPNRNCSDLIRSLAAKYQNANPSEWVVFYVYSILQYVYIFFICGSLPGRREFIHRNTYFI